MGRWEIAAVILLFCQNGVVALPWVPAGQTIAQAGMMNRRAPQPTAMAKLDKRVNYFPQSVCGFIGGIVSSPALCSTDSSCVWDTNNQIVGCVPSATGTTAIYTGCQDSSSTDTGLGDGQLQNAIFTCTGDEVCYRNTYDALSGSTYYQYGCGQADYATTVATSPLSVTNLVAEVRQTSINLRDVGNSASDSSSSTTPTSSSVTVTTLTSTSGGPPPSTSTTPTSSTPPDNTTRTINTTSIHVSTSTAIVTYTPPVSSRSGSAGSSTSSSPSSSSQSSTATLSPDTGGGKGGGSNSTGAIVGGAVGGVAGLAIVGAALFYLLRRHKHNKAMQKVSQASGGPKLPPYDAYSAHAAAHQQEKAVAELPNEPVQYELEGNNGFLQKGPAELPDPEAAAGEGTSDVKGKAPSPPPATTGDAPSSAVEAPATTTTAAGAPTTTHASTDAPTTTHAATDAAATHTAPPPIPPKVNG